VVHPAYGQYILASVDLNGVTTATVAVQGRTSSAFDWVTLLTVTEATAADARSAVVARLPEMRASLTNLSGGSVDASLTETDQDRP
jgi:hypothetical protein